MLMSSIMGIRTNRVVMLGASLSRECHRQGIEGAFLRPEPEN